MCVALCVCLLRGHSLLFPPCSLLPVWALLVQNPGRDLVVDALAITIVHEACDHPFEHRKDDGKPLIAWPTQVGHELTRLL